MSFSDTELAELREFCGYPDFGNNPVQNFGWRFSIRDGDFEFRILNMSLPNISKIQTFYLPNLRLLQQDLVDVRDNSDIQSAAVYYRNPRELQERQENYNRLRVELCNVIGCDEGPALAAKGFRLVI